MADDSSTLQRFSDAEEHRYARHFTLPLVGREGQRRLARARVLLVGAGGLGSPAALYLAAAGVGTLAIVDGDVVDVSNLQRQVLHGTADVGRPKVDSARARLADLNPHVRVETIGERLTADNARRLVAGCDVVLDGTDNFETRYVVNDACVAEGKPLVHASVHRFQGQASVFAPGGPCYRCAFPAPPPPGSAPGCAEAGVLGVVPGLLGILQAGEALKLLLGIGETLAGRLLLVDVLRMEFATIELARDPGCPACGTGGARDGWGGALPASGAGSVPEMTPAELRARLAAEAELVVLDVREPWEWEATRIEGARLVPLGALRGAIASLDRERETVVYCESGFRSAEAVRLLTEAGFARVWNLAGGIARWNREAAAPPSS